VKALWTYDGAVSQEGTVRTGVFYAASAFVMWGLFPVYWKALGAVPALEVVAHRTAWGLVFVALWVTVRRRWGEVRAAVRNPRTLAMLAGTAAVVSVNWLLFVWAVVNDHVTEASLGYFINPLVTVLLGVVVLKERLNRPRAIAVILAGVGVVVMTLGIGRLPWVAVGLALSFGLYGLARKTVAADAVIGLLVETAILTPLAGGYIVVLGLAGSGVMGRAGFSADALLILGGAVTAVPLVLFTLGARRLPLSTVGMLQYLAPTGQFLLAVFVYREPFSTIHAVSFSLIWSALGILTWDLHRRLRPRHPHSRLTGNR